jgi:hypothetical protein
VGVMPAKADPEAQEEFLNKTRASVRGSESRAPGSVFGRCGALCPGR